MIDYIIFGGLFLAGLIIWGLHEVQRKKNPVVIDDPYMKCESPIERILYKALRNAGFDVQTQVQCGSYRIDMVLPTYKIAVEADGKAYHSTPARKARDKRRDAYLRRQGYKVLRFSGRQIMRNARGCIVRIEKEIQKATS